MAKERIFLAVAVALVRELNKQRKVTSAFRQEAKILQRLSRGEFFKGVGSLVSGLKSFDTDKLKKTMDQMKQSRADWAKYKSYRKDNFKDLVGATMDQAKGALGVVPASLNSFGRKSAEIAAAAGALGLTGLQKTGKILAAPFVGAYLLGGKIADIAKTKAGQLATFSIRNYQRAKKGVINTFNRTTKSVAKNFNRFKNWVPDTKLGRATRIGWEFTAAIGRQTKKDLSPLKGLPGKIFGGIKDAISKAANSVKDHYADEIDVAKKNADAIKKPALKVVKKEEPVAVVTRMRADRASGATGRLPAGVRRQDAGIPIARAAQPKVPKNFKKPGHKTTHRIQHKK